MSLSQHASEPKRRLSLHTSEQVVKVVKDPPEQVHPVSGTQVEEQPSLSIVFPSSHYSVSSK